MKISNLHKFILSALLFLMMGNSAYSHFESSETAKSINVWEIIDIELTANMSYSWWEFPAKAVFTHSSGKQLILNAFFYGNKNWIVRFTPTLPGKWKYVTQSHDKSLDGVSGEIIARIPEDNEVVQNPNLKGHLRFSENRRYFIYSDNSPVLLLGDTNWSVNTHRCGLGKNQNGPFFTYLKDRKEKQFNTIIMSFMRGFGDTNTEPAGQRNEGGYPFNDNEVDQLNANYFQFLDKRMNAIWEYGFISAVNPTWFAKMKNCFFEFEWAKRISSYLITRYGAYNLIYSLSGEYAYALKDCGWNDTHLNELGDLVQKYNTYNHPVSIHPSGRTDWLPPHNVQSSNPFSHSNWMDHYWLQTGQKVNMLHNIQLRSYENYSKNPRMPVFLSEAYYERHTDNQHVYHTRWQPWVALFNGACGYGYGAFGIWQFYDNNDKYGETGKEVQNVIPWQDAIQFKGGNQIKHVTKFFASIRWWKLIPNPRGIFVNDTITGFPTEDNISPPHFATVPDELYVVYIPKGNKSNTLKIKVKGDQNYSLKWYSPGTGNEMKLKNEYLNQSLFTMAELPDPEEDWIFMLEKLK